MTSVRTSLAAVATAALTTVGLAAAGVALTAQAAPSGPTSGSATGSSAAAVQLPPSGRIDYQLGGATTFSPAPAVVTRDSTDQPMPGVYSICYVNAFQSQPGDTSLKASWLKVGGSYVADPNWPDEYVLDTRGRRADLVAAFTSVLQTCAAKGFKAVEFDNLDSYDRSKGALSTADNLAYAKDLIAAAHARGLATGQKNAAELVGQAPFDFAVAESCLRYDECGDYTAGYSVVLDIEYKEEMSASTFQSKCAKAVAAGRAPSFEFRDLALSANGTRQWCDAQLATSTSSPTATRTTTTTTRSTRTHGTWTHRTWTPGSMS